MNLELKFRRFAPKCRSCSQSIFPTDYFHKARDFRYHISCFVCLVCRKQLSTGDEFYIIDETKFVCKMDLIRYQQQHHVSASNSPLDSPEFEDTLAESSPQDGESSIDRYRDVVSGGSGANSPHNSAATPSNNHSAPEDMGSTGNAGPSSNDEGPGGGKRRGPRTTIKAKQLETLKNAFNATPKPTRHIREQLAQETGLNMRVIQVWFQNRRSKERRMKQLSSMGARRHFYRNPRRAMRPLRTGIMEDGMPHNAAFAYFSDSNSPNDFSYGPHQGFYEYFPGHHPPTSINDFPGTLSIGNNMDHPVPMSNGNGNLGSDPSYVSPSSDCLRSSPENGMAVLADYAQRQQQATANASNFAPFVPSHANETRIW